MPLARGTVVRHRKGSGIGDCQKCVCVGALVGGVLWCSMGVKGALVLYVGGEEV